MIAKGEAYFKTVMSNSLYLWKHKLLDLQDLFFWCAGNSVAGYYGSFTGVFVESFGRLPLS